MLYRVQVKITDNFSNRENIVSNLDYQHSFFMGVYPKADMNIELKNGVKLTIESSFIIQKIFDSDPDFLIYVTD